MMPMHAIEGIDLDILGRLAGVELVGCALNASRECFRLTLGPATSRCAWWGKRIDRVKVYDNGTAHCSRFCAF